jgi:hypothetical protein
MLDELLAVHDRRVDSFAGIVEHDNTAALPAHILCHFIHDALKHGSQIERRRDLAADVIEKFE